MTSHIVTASGGMFMSSGAAAQASYPPPQANLIYKDPIIAQLARIEARLDRLESELGMMANVLGDKLGDLIDLITNIKAGEITEEDKDWAEMALVEQEMALRAQERRGREIMHAIRDVSR